LLAFVLRFHSFNAMKNHTGIEAAREVIPARNHPSSLVTLIAPIASKKDSEIKHRNAAALRRLISIGSIGRDIRETTPR
jgi:hypothetical protein